MVDKRYTAVIAVFLKEFEWFSPRRGGARKAPREKSEIRRSRTNDNFKFFFGGKFLSEKSKGREKNVKHVHKFGVIR